MALRDRDEHSHRAGRPDHQLERIRWNFLSDRRLRFLVNTIALVVGVFLLVMFELPPLFGLAFVAWWVVWSLQRDAADIYREVFDINEFLATRAEEGGDGTENS